MPHGLGVRDGTLQINPDRQVAKASPVSGTKSLTVRCAQGCVSRELVIFLFHRKVRAGHIIVDRDAGVTQGVRIDLLQCSAKWCS